MAAAVKQLCLISHLLLLTLLCAVCSSLALQPQQQQEQQMGWQQEPSTLVRHGDLPGSKTEHNSPTNPDDVLAIKALFHSTNGPNWSNKLNWMNGEDPCSSKWYGITCEMVDNETRVVEVFERYNNLVGHIPTELAKLTQLRSLTISYNSLQGEIPHFLFHSLHALQHLELSMNSLNGTLPTKFAMPDMVDLYLDGNKIAGPIPEVWETPRLQNLLLNQNKFSGFLPQEISNLRNLKQLDLSQNSLTGPLISSYGNLSNLSKLSLHQNHFVYSPIPEGWSGMKGLMELHLDRLEGVLPPTIGEYWPVIENIEIDDGRLTGKIPNSICELKQLNSLMIFNNMLEGTLPSCLCTMRNLAVIKLPNNRITGSIPDCIFDMPFLFELGLAKNNMTGTLPKSIGKAGTFLQLFDIRDNSFYGSIPASIDQLLSMSKFNISGNYFHSVPYGTFQFFSSLYIQIEFYGGYCDMSNNPWRCPLPIYIRPSMCKTKCLL